MRNFKCLTLLRQNIRSSARLLGIGTNTSSISIQYGEVKSRFSTNANTSSLNENLLLRHLKARIKANGPVTVAEYMKEVLINPVSGYYMNKDVLGKKGDYTTSPEISQMFGELLGIWCVNEYIQAKLTGPLNIVELGPGRGTLADDMCRVFTNFRLLKDKVAIHLIEVSPTLSGIQAAKLGGSDEPVNITPQPSNKPYYHCITNKYGQEVYWYRSLQDVPKGNMYYIAHEFFDALPIHKFQKTDDRGWQEILVDINEDSIDKSKALQFVLSGRKTAALTYLQLDEEEKRDHIEVSPEAGIIMQQICSRIKENGGALLIGDYGHDGVKTDTFRGFKNHKLHDVLTEPGTADLTADVDFSFLRKMAEQIGVKAHGPKAQQEFLHNMGIGIRLQILLQNVKADEWKDLLSGYDMLVNPEKMGQRFQFFGVTSGDDKDYVPAGFENIASAMSDSIADKSVKSDTDSKT